MHNISEGNENNFVDNKCNFNDKKNNYDDTIEISGKYSENGKTLKKLKFSDFFLNYLYCCFKKQKKKKNYFCLKSDCL